MIRSASSPISQDYPITISDFDFRCHRSSEYEYYSNLGKYVIVQPQDESPLKTTFDLCYSNVVNVLNFLDTNLNYSGLDNKGRDLIININCTNCDNYYENHGTYCRIPCNDSQPESETRIACFLSSPNNEQFLFGQIRLKGQLISISTCLTIVAHEIFHAVTHFSCDLDYDKNGISGALHESYSDIFAVLVNNLDNPDIGSWQWAVGDESFDMIRYFNNERKMSDYEDRESCYDSMIIHNFAVYKMICTQDNSGEYLFRNKIEMLPVFFYKALERLGQATDKRKEKSFRDSRMAIKSSARTVFNSDEIENAIDEAFDYAEIYA